MCDVQTIDLQNNWVAKTDHSFKMTGYLQNNIMRKQSHKAKLLMFPYKALSLVVNSV